MRLVFILALLVFLSGCESSIPKENLKYLNGYWEIVQVKFPDGSKKEYGINTIVDYIEVKNRSGFRKKMQPNLEGTYLTSDDSEQFELVEQDGRFLMRYRNGNTQWEEELLTLEENIFSIKNQEHITYIYKRFEPLNLNP